MRSERNDEGLGRFRISLMIYDVLVVKSFVLLLVQERRRAYANAAGLSLSCCTARRAGRWAVHLSTGTGTRKKTL